MTNSIKKYLVFKSEPLFFFKERDGSKPNTIREVKDKDDYRLHLLEHGNPKKIKIINAGNPKMFFTRKITDISYWNGLWIISWKHEVD
jgi:hypothetical protein